MACSLLALAASQIAFAQSPVQPAASGTPKAALPAQSAPEAPKAALPATLPAKTEAVPAGPATPKTDNLNTEGTVSGILMILPFDNQSGHPSLEWIREASAELLERRFASAGFAPMSRADRLYALDHLGLPAGFQPSRASSLRLAQTLDAQAIVVGSFHTDGSDLVAEARMVDVPRLLMSEAVTARGPMSRMVDILDSLAWKLTRQLDPHFSIPEETFVAAGRNLRLDAFEQYIRGITETDQQERLRHLQQSVTLNAKFSPAWMALGRDAYSAQHYDEAASDFAKVNASDPDALEASFYRGISLIFSGDYPQAVSAFAAVAHKLPLAEVLNNQGVAESRREQDASALFRQAVSADPNNADYHFNLAISLKRHGNAEDAHAELAQCLRLRPADEEALDLDEQWKKPGNSQTEPLERIVRSFDAAAFRQAMQLLEQTEAARLATLDPHAKAMSLAAQASDALDHGLLLEAERLYLAAAGNDSKIPAIHAGLAAVREQSGDSEGARKEARLSLELLPSPEAYLVLARLDLAAGHIDEAMHSIEATLAIAPDNKQALELQNRIQGKPEPK